MVFRGVRAKRATTQLITRNTGHDFMGRSTGYGALAINTHSFKSTLGPVQNTFVFGSETQTCFVRQVFNLPRGTPAREAGLVVLSRSVLESRDENSCDLQISRIQKSLS